MKQLRINPIQYYTNPEHMHFFRKSTDEDADNIRKLLIRCFGDFPEKEGALKELKQRYLLCWKIVEPDNLNTDYFEYARQNAPIAMTGVRFTEFSGSVDWTCCIPEQRRKGLITTMLTDCLSSAADVPCYCACWQWEGHRQSNLHGVMRRLGFIEAAPDSVPFEVWHKYRCPGCVRKNVPGCKCREILYERKANTR